MGNWNPRYAILFMSPFYVLAAYGVTTVSDSLRSAPARIAWFICVAVLLLPKLASHWQDGSRHDLRVAAAVAATHVGNEESVFCNWPMELAYYLRAHGNSQVVGWWKGDKLPDSSCVIVYASNALEPVLRLQGRRCEVLAEICFRRFDEQSHCVRVYNVGAIESGN